MVWENVAKWECDCALGLRNLQDVLAKVLLGSRNIGPKKPLDIDSCGGVGAFLFVCLFVCLFVAGTQKARLKYTFKYSPWP